MKKIWFEIIVSTGLVLLLIALVFIVEMAFPQGQKSTGFVMIISLYMIAMGFVGVKMVDMQ